MFNSFSQIKIRSISYDILFIYISVSGNYKDIYDLTDTITKNAHCDLLTFKRKVNTSILMELSQFIDPMRNSS